MPLSSAPFGRSPMRPALTVCSLLWAAGALSAAPMAQASLTLQAGLQAASLGDADPLVGRTDPSLDEVVVGWEPRTGVRVGVGLHVPVAPRVAVRPEWVYAQKGGDVIYAGEFGVGRAAQSRTFSDLETLALLHVDVLRDERITAALEAGPALMVRLDETPCRARRSEPCIEDDAPGRASVGAAVGTVLSAGPGGVGVRYTWGGRDTAPAGTPAKPVTEMLSVSFHLRFR